MEGSCDPTLSPFPYRLQTPQLRHVMAASPPPRRQEEEEKEREGGEAEPRQSGTGELQELVLAHWWQALVAEHEQLELQLFQLLKLEALESSSLGAKQ